MKMGLRFLLALGLLSVAAAAYPQMCTYSRSFNSALPNRISAGVTFIAGTNMPPACSVVGMVSTTGNLRCSVVTTAPGQYNCPTGGGNCRALLGWVSPTTALMGPHSCSFACGACGSFTVTNADGLPVELMDFEIADPEPAGE